MEYTKDMIFNIQYKEDIEVIRLKKRGIKDKILKFINDNKVAVFTFTCLSILITIDIVLVNTFFNLLTAF